MNGKKSWTRNNGWPAPATVNHMFTSSAVGTEKRKPCGSLKKKKLLTNAEAVRPPGHKPKEIVGGAGTGFWAVYYMVCVFPRASRRTPSRTAAVIFVTTFMSYPLYPLEVSGGETTSLKKSYAHRSTPGSNKIFVCFQSFGESP